MAEPLFDHIAFIGIGLINSSLARAAKEHGLAEVTVAYSRTEATRHKAADLGIVDIVTGDMGDAVEKADLVIIGTPLGAYKTVAAEIVPHLRPGTIVTDVGSVKQAVIRDLGPMMPDGVHLVPGHPIAGTENSGPESGFAELFKDRWCILTPPPGTDEAAVAKVKAFWEGVGSNVELMDAGHHDQVLAITSHLPHLIAYTIVGTATDLEDHLRQEVIKFSASGFRDFTRIAASDPVMWRDVLLNNKDAVLETLQRFSEDLTAMQRAIRRDEAETLEALFKRTRDIRRSVIEAKQA